MWDRFGGRIVTWNLQWIEWFDTKPWKLNWVSHSLKYWINFLGFAISVSMSTNPHKGASFYGDAVHYRSRFCIISLTFITKNFCNKIDFSTIAVRDLAPDPLHRRMKSNWVSTRASTSTTKSPVFVAKLEDWEMYFAIYLFLYALFCPF